MSEVTIRHAVIADAPAIAKMLGQLAEFLGDGDKFRSTGELIAQHGFGTRAMFEVVIAEQDGNPVGLALFFEHFSTTKGQPGTYVQDLWIDPEQRGSGIGERLLATVATYSAKTWGAAYIKLTVHADNSRAKQFYQRLGFDAATNETALIANTPAFNALRGPA